MISMRALSAANPAHDPVLNPDIGPVLDPALDQKVDTNPSATALYCIPDSNHALTSELTRLAGHINAAQYRFLKLLAALIEREAWGGDCGMKTPAHWLNYYCGIDLGAAREKVRVAKALQALPQVDAAFASGAISYSKVRALTRCATTGNEAAYLNVARHGTAQHMETLVRQHQRVQRLQRDAGTIGTIGTGNNATGNTSQHQARELTWYFDEDGMLILKGRFAPEEGAVLIKALEAALDSIEQERKQGQGTDVSAETSQRFVSDPDSAPDSESVSDSESDAESDSTFPRKRGNAQEASSVPKAALDVSAETSAPADAKSTFPQKRADALLCMTEHFLATHGQGTQALASADKYQVLIHLDARSGSDSQHSGLFSCINPGIAPGVVASLDDGPPLPAATSKRLLCDASLVPVVRDDAGNVLNIGRKSRAVPPAMRRALKIRDGGCRHPGCTQTRHVDAHHIQHWCDGGETSLDNLVLLCRTHHRLLHEHAFSIECSSDRHHPLRFLDQHGKEIRPTLWPQFAAPRHRADGRSGIELDNARHGVRIDAGTAVTQWRGERMDYGMAIDGLV